MIDMVLAMENIPEIVRYIRHCQVYQRLSGISENVRYIRDCQVYQRMLGILEIRY